MIMIPTTFYVPFLKVSTDLSFSNSDIQICEIVSKPITQDPKTNSCSLMENLFIKSCPR